jgi:hypothetical protein
MDGTAILGFSLAAILVFTGVSTGFGLAFLLGAAEAGMGLLPVLVERG